MESRLVKFWIEKTHSKRFVVAEMLGINVSTLWRLLAKRQIPQPYALALQKLMEQNPNGVGRESKAA